MAFFGGNVRIARVFRGLSQEELAEKVYTSAATIWQVERDSRRPSDTLVAALGLVLGFEPAFFARAMPHEFTPDDCFFRARVSASERMRKKVLARGTLFADVVSYLQTSLALPPYNVPEYAASSHADIEKAAVRCREEWGLGIGPVSNMCRALENNGVMVTQLTGESAKLDAFSSKPRGTDLGFVVISDAKDSATRSRFDMAHELGHLVMHRSDAPDLETREAQADRFAACFLLPGASFAKEFWSGGGVDWALAFRLKARWKVSVQAIVFRAFELGVINALEYRRAYKLMSARGWRTGEPHEPKAEQPELFTKAMRTLKERRGVEAGDIADVMGWTPQTFEDVTGWKPAAQPEGSGVRLALVKSERRIARTK